MNELNRDRVQLVSSKDIKEGGITLTYIENVSLCGRDDDFDVFALPGSTVKDGRKTVTGRKKARAMILKYLSNPNERVKAKLAKLADKTVSRIQYSMRADRSVMGA